jgi:hypothetical protein
MNEASVEQGVVAFLAAQLPEGTVLRKGTDIREKPTGQKIIIAAVREVPRDVGSLYRGLLTLLIQTPVLMAANGSPINEPADHGTMVSAVEAAINPRVDASAADPQAEAERVAAVKAALDAAMQAAADCKCGSTYSEGPRSSHNEGHWITTIDVILGLERL